MKKQSFRLTTRWLTDTATAVLICIFVYAALSKLLEYHLFTLQLHQHPYLRSIAATVAWGLPAAELIVAALMTIPATRMAGLYSTCTMLVIFTVYLEVMLLSGKHLPCACGGIISSLNWKQHMVFNTILIAMAVVTIISKRKFLMRKRPLQENIFADL
jgi:hypothetical protein